MLRLPYRRSPAARLLALAALAAGSLAVAAPAPVEVVILKDGFTIQGRVAKETVSVNDKATGSSVLVAKAAGFDMISDGARVVVFSSHHKQLGEISTNVKIRPEYKAYTNTFAARRSSHPLPFMTGAKEQPDFDAKWRRTLKVGVGDGLVDTIVQQLTYLDPYCCIIASPTHLWSQSFRTSEMDPAKVRKLLSTHPELAEPDGKPDPVKRIAIARFMKDVGWLYLAKEEIDRLNKEVPPPLAKDAQEQLDKLQKDLDAATAELVVAEAEAALAAGRYGYAGELLPAFADKTADPKDVTRYAQVKARFETARDQYDAGRRLLRGVIDDVTGAGKAVPFLAVGGGPLAVAFPARAANTQLAELAAAAESVYAELHPDSAGRVEYFVNLAGQVERERTQGREPSKKPEELLATAISGWAKGKNGATPAADTALRIWRARTSVLTYQRTPTSNGRSAVLAAYQQASPVGIEELTQIISLLPPAEAEDLSDRTGTLLKVGGGVPDGVYKRKSAPFGSRAAGVEYLVRLPPEYRHGRAYPVGVVLTYPGLPAEQLIGAIANEADRQGYILLAPLWTVPFDGKTGWDWDGADHDYVTATLRDAVRHFTVDNDRVFLIGGGAGADMAMDVGVSHPDLFAGVVAVGPNPRTQGMFSEYWGNAQKLPFYVVSGELSGTANQNLRWIFDKWMPHGFPALNVVYRGRGVEWFPAETPVMFDWMGRKKRANGTAVLALGPGVQRYRWHTMRAGDDRFYWLSADQIDARRLTPDGRPRAANPYSATLLGDIRAGNQVVLEAHGVRTVGVWLGRDMIDWSQPVKVALNGSTPYGWKPKKLEPDVRVLLEDYWQRGDRRMLYLAKLEFPNAQ